MCVWMRPSPDDDDDDDNQLKTGSLELPEVNDSISCLEAAGFSFLRLSFGDRRTPTWQFWRKTNIDVFVQSRESTH